jgi:hypothetical protein
MGRDLSFYAVNINIPHDKSAKICLDLEHDLTHEELQDELFRHLYPEEDSNLNDYSIYIKKTSKVDWCNRCYMFARSLYEAKAVIASVDFRHSYSDPIWRSDWHFYNMHPGKRHSDFCNRFDSDKMYREIDQSDITDLKESLCKYGKAYRTPDLEAIEETQKVIKFCEEHIKNPEVTIIYASEV